MSRGRQDERPSRLYKESRRFLAEVKTLGARVRALRQERDWTLEEAAEHMGLDLKHLQKIEAGDPPINVTLVTVCRIAEGLGVAVGELFPVKGKGRRRPH